MNRSAVWRLRDVYWGGWNCCSSCPCHPAPLSSQGSTDLEPPAGVRSIPFILFVPVRLCLSLKMGFPGGSAGKESTCSAGDLVWSLGWETTWRREWLPTPVFWPGEFPGLYSPWARKELDLTEWLSLSWKTSNKETRGEKKKNHASLQKDEQSSAGWNFKVHYSVDSKVPT